MKSFHSAIIAIIAMSANSWSAITVNGAGSLNDVVGGASLLGSSFTGVTAGDITGADKLIVTFVVEQNSFATGMTYNGDAMTFIGLGYNGSNWNRTEMWYIDASSVTGGAFSDGNLVISHTETVMQVGMVAVSGTADGVLASQGSASRTDSIAFTPGADNALVVSSYATATQGAPTVAGPSGYTLFLNGSSTGGGGYGGGSAYWEDQANSETTYGPWGPDSAREGMVIASFAPVPEPSSILLVGLGAIVLATRRRR